MKKHSGFTLIELLITLVIVGVLLSVGMPSLKTFMQGSQLIASTNELLSALHIARSEAVKLNSSVSVCSSTDDISCADSADWSTGWIVFVDSDGNLSGTEAACTAVGTDCLLRVHEAISDSLLSVSGKVDSDNTDIKSFTFNARGLPTVTGVSDAGAFSICSFDSSDNVIASRAVVLSLSGRVRVSDNDAAIDCPASP